MGRHTLGAHRDAATESATSGQALLIFNDSDIHDSVKKNSSIGISTHEHGPFFV